MSALSSGSPQPYSLSRQNVLNAVHASKIQASASQKMAPATPQKPQIDWIKYLSIGLGLLLVGTLGMVGIKAGQKVLKEAEEAERLAAEEAKKKLKNTSPENKVDRLIKEQEQKLEEANQRRRQAQGAKQKAEEARKQAEAEKEAKQKKLEDAKKQQEEFLRKEKERQDAELEQKRREAEQKVNEARRQAQAEAQRRADEARRQAQAEAQRRADEARRQSSNSYGQESSSQTQGTNHASGSKPPKKAESPEEKAVREARELKEEQERVARKDAEKAKAKISNKQLKVDAIATFNKLNQLINQKLFNPEFNLQEYRQDIEKILDNLRQKSVNMIDNNPSLTGWSEVKEARTEAADFPNTAP